MRMPNTIASKAEAAPLRHFLHIIPRIASLMLLCFAAMEKPAYADYFTGDVTLEVFASKPGRLTNQAVFSATLQLAMDSLSGDWFLNYHDNNQKFVEAQSNTIIEKPNVAASTNSWYIVSELEEGYPIDLDFDERLIWFAYLGRKCIREREGNYMPALYGSTRFDSYVHGCIMHASWHSEMALAPEVANFEFDQSLFKNGVEKLSFEPPGQLLNDRKRQFEHLAQSYTNHQAMETFHVIQWTKVGETEFPSEWKLLTYWYGRPSITCIGHGSNFRSVKGTFTAPAIAHKARVTDERLRNPALKFNSVDYRIANGRIPTVQQAKVYAEQQAMKFNNSVQSQMPHRSKRSHIIVTAWAVISVGFLAALLVKSKRKSNGSSKR